VSLLAATARPNPACHRWTTSSPPPGPHAAGKGDLDLVRELTALGADPDIRDTRFGGPPLGWARYFGQERTARFLAPLTADDPAD
jgi:ankyrin repeat protein